MMQKLCNTILLLEPGLNHAKFLIVVKHCGKLIITGKSVLYFKSSGKVESKQPIILAGGIEFYLNRFG